MRRWICGVLAFLLVFQVMTPVEVHANRMIEAQQVMEGEPELSFEVVDRQVILSWTAVKGATHYEVFRKTANGKYKRMKTTKKLIYADKAVEDESLYYYRVRAIRKKDKKVCARTDYSNTLKHYYDYVDVTKKMVALTFDDGPSAYTEDILNCLEENHARATFFVVGCYVSGRAATVKRAVSLGCEVGNHSYSHPNLINLSDSQILSEIQKTKDAIEKATDYQYSPAWLRAPYGSSNSRVNRLVETPIAFWSIDTLDWKYRNSQKVINCVLSEVRDGSIVLMHDSISTTRDAALYLIPELKRRGYELLTMSEMAHYKKVKLEKGVVYYNFY